jgi:hypothetical protein
MTTKERVGVNCTGWLERACVEAIQRGDNLSRRAACRKEELLKAQAVDRLHTELAGDMNSEAVYIVLSWLLVRCNYKYGEELDCRIKMYARDFVPNPHRGNSVLVFTEALRIFKTMLVRDFGFARLQANRLINYVAVTCGGEDELEDTLGALISRAW